MSEVAIYQPKNELIPVSASPRGELDDWIMVADQVVRLAEVICRSPFVPDGLRGSAPATAAAILTGRELGIPPMTSLANIHVIHGKPGLSALVMRALVMREGHDWEEVEANNTRVVLRGKRKEKTTWTTASFTVQDAATAKLQLGAYPQDKLYARASARLARRAFADIIAGMPYSLEELEDGFTPDEDTAAPAAEAAPAEQPRRTAQRATRQRTSPPPAPAASQQAAATPAASSQQQDAGGDHLPPLPGEDEDPTTSGASSSADAPGSASPARTGEPSQSTSDGSAPGDERHRKMVGIVQQHFKRLGYTDEDRDARLWAASRIAIGDDRPDITSLTDLTPEDLSLVADTLAKCRDRQRLEALLAEREGGAGGE